MAKPASPAALAFRALGYGLPGSDRTFGIRFSIAKEGGLWDPETKTWWFPAREARDRAKALETAAPTPPPKPGFRRFRRSARWSPQAPSYEASEAKMQRDEPRCCPIHSTILEVPSGRCVQCIIGADAARNARADRTPPPPPTPCYACKGRGAHPDTCYSCRKLRVPNGQVPSNTSSFVVTDCSRCKTKDVWCTRSRTECRDCAVKPGGEFASF